MRTIALLLLLCLPAYAQLPPLPPVKRTAPLLSPRAASEPKRTPMFVPASENPPLPMVAYFAVVNSPFGKYEFSAQSLQPAGYALLFEVSPVLAGWQPLAWFAPYVEDQQAFGALYSRSEVLFIRATAQPPAAPPPAILTEAGSTILRSESGTALKSARRKILVNKHLNAWARVLP